MFGYICSGYSPEPGLRGLDGFTGLLLPLTILLPQWSFEK
jgi:hypothetical protein